MEFKLLLIVHLFLLQLFVSPFLAQNNENPEREALLTFKNTLENPNLLSSWIPYVSHCKWEGILCNKNGEVVSVLLSTQSLRGTLSVSLFSISTINVLDLGNNELSGEIPTQIGELTQLHTLKLGPNFFTGKIPPEIGNLTHLRLLDLSSNGFLSIIPFELWKLIHLEVLGLGNNLLSGSLFASLFTELKSLISLDVSNNSFSGSIPPEIGNLKNLIDLYIGINGFSGALPPEIGGLSNLRHFFSPSCNFRGPLPVEIAELKLLSKLDLSYNPLQCSIPKSIGKLDNLEILNLVYAQLNGSIPSELGNCRNLKTLMHSFNSLYGSLPKELAKLPMLSFSDEKNQLSGPLPSWLGKWNAIDSLLLASNRFTDLRKSGSVDLSKNGHSRSFKERQSPAALSKSGPYRISYLSNLIVH